MKSQKESSGKQLLLFFFPILIGTFFQQLVQYD